MEKNNFENIFYLYPKSNNHKIFLTKKDNIGVCDLNTDCTKANFSISKNKFNKIFNNEISNNKKSNVENFSCINCINDNLNTYLSNYDIILFFLIIVFFIVLKYIHKK